MEILKFLFLVTSTCFMILNDNVRENAAPSIHLIYHFPSGDAILKMQKGVNKVFQKLFRKLPIESYLLKCITDVDDSAVLETYCKNQFDVHFTFKKYILFARFHLQFLHFWQINNTLFLHKFTSLLYLKYF